MSVEFYRVVERADVERSNHPDTPRERGIRLYCTSSAATHGTADARYALQVRAPMRLARAREGKDFMVATASLSLADLVVLGEATRAAIAEIGAAAKGRRGTPKKGQGKR